MQQWQEEMNIRLSGKKVPPKYWEYPEFEKGNIHKHCAYCIDLNCPKTLDLEFLFTNENENNNEEEDGTELHQLQEDEDDAGDHPHVQTGHVGHPRY